MAKDKGRAQEAMEDGWRMKRRRWPMRRRTEDGGPEGYQEREKRPQNPSLSIGRAKAKENHKKKRREERKK